MSDRKSIELAYAEMREYQQIGQTSLLATIDTRLINIGGETARAEINGDHEALKVLRTEKDELFRYKTAITKNQAEIERLFDKINPSAHISSIAANVEQRNQAITEASEAISASPVDASPVTVSPPTPSNGFVKFTTPPSQSTVLVTNDGKKMRLPTAESMLGQSKRNGNYVNNKPNAHVPRVRTNIQRGSDFTPANEYDPFLLRMMLRFKDETHAKFAFVAEEAVELMKREGHSKIGDEEVMSSNRTRSTIMVETRRMKLVMNKLIYSVTPGEYHLTEYGLAEAKRYQDTIDQRRLATVA